MTRSLTDLDQKFEIAVRSVLSGTQAIGFTLVPFYTLRTPSEQARLWRQSRGTQEIRDAIYMLQRNEAFYLADCLESVGPQNGRWATNALPGNSWHQWGLAVDCFVNSHDGRALWGGRGDGPDRDFALDGYRTYGAAAKSHGLTWGGDWTSADLVHVQATEASSPHSTGRTWLDIDRAMAELHGA